MKKIIDVWANIVVKNRIVTIIAAIILAGIFVLPLKNLYFEASTDMWFVEGDPVLTRYKTLKELFKSDENLVVGIEASQGETVFTSKTLDAIKKITDFLDGHEAVDQVRSITNFQYIHGEDDVLDVQDLVPIEIDSISEMSPEQIQAMADIAAKETLIHGLIITKDLKHTLVNARIAEPSEGEGDQKIKLFQDFNTFLEQEGLDKLGIDYKIAGPVAIVANYFFSSMWDQSIIYPLMIVIIIVLLFIIFRSLAGVTLPFVVVLCSAIVALGFTGLMGWPLNMLNVLLPVMLIAIGLCDAIHIIAAFYEQRHSGLEPKAAAIESVKKYYLPCLYTSLTTSIGFMALSVSKLNPVLEFGLSAAVGVIAAFLFSVTLLPAILSFVRGNEKQIARLIEAGGSVKIIQLLPDFTINNRKIILLLTAVVAVLSIVFMSFIEVDTNFVRNFKKEASLRKSIEYFDDAYNGAMTLEFILDSGGNGGVNEPEFLNKALNFQRYVEAHEGTGKASSMLNFLLKLNQVLHNDDSAYYTIPESRELVAQYLFLYTSSGPEEDLTDMQDHNERFLRISVLCNVAPSSVTKQWVETIEKEIEDNYKDLNIVITGRTVLFNNMDVYTQQGMIRSFSLALGLIIICFFVLLRSFSYGLLAIIPSVLPIMVAGGVMGIFGIYLDFSSIVVAAVTIGLAVDDTIHFMMQYIQARKAGKDNKEAIHIAVSHAGRAIFFTSIILFCGFIILIFSTFVPNIYLGLLGGIIILLALVGDLIVLPALITVSKK